jgi:hypothetical protein
MSSGQIPRDVVNHYLFEIATEVANRGLLNMPNTLTTSRWYLFGAQIKGTREEFSS